MSGEMRKISIKDIVNYYENPRHAIASSEKDTLKKLFEAVGNQYMLNLAEDIKTHGLLGNQQIVVVYSEEIKKYVVYEGNRRVAAIKMLQQPSDFDFLDNASREKAEKLSSQISESIGDVMCYVTDEEEAFFIMERLHSGEDKGRGLKAWNAKEKEIFKVRQSNQKSISYLIDFYVKKYCGDFDITSIMPFTTIQRIFGNREVRGKIGLDIADETSFTAEKMQLVLSVVKEIEESAKAAGVPVTRLYNRARDIEDKVIPMIDGFGKHEVSEGNSEVPIKVNQDTSPQNDNVGHDNSGDNTSKMNLPTQSDGSESPVGNSTPTVSQPSGAGGSKNLPYFFLGIDYSKLDPADVDSHGIAEVCRELQYFSEKKLVDKLPIAAVFLVRSAIEQAIIYYSKKHYIQGQNKLIWENVKGISKLSNIIANYNKNLPNYITDAVMRQYFTSLFGDYEKNVDPLNWVVHRPAEFQLDTRTLIELPKKGLLTLINYLIA